MEGFGLDCKGLIVTQNNDTVTSFQSVHNGMGNFQLKPEKIKLLCRSEIK
jgi:hypothetical protein